MAPGACADMPVIEKPAAPQRASSVRSGAAETAEMRASNWTLACAALGLERFWFSSTSC